MKFSCEKALLQSMITIASRAVAPKSTIPALEGVLLEAEQELNLTGYNLKTGIRGTISADIAEPGSIVLSARLFGDIIRRLPDGYDTVISDSDFDNSKSLDDEMSVVIAIVAVIVVAVLLLTSQTYMEIPVLLITFVVGIILNKGTNFIFGEISFVSNSVTAVLQLALSQRPVF